MSMFHDSNFYYNDLARTIADEITSALSSGVESLQSYALWNYPIFIDADETELIITAWMNPSFEIAQENLLD